MSVDVPAPAQAPAPERNPLFAAARAGTLFMRPVGEVPTEWGAPWKLIPPDWVVGPVGLLLVKDFDIPAGYPGRIDGFGFAMRDRSNKAVWFVPVEPIVITGQSAVRLSRAVSVPEFMPSTPDASA